MIHKDKPCFTVLPVQLHSYAWMDKWGWPWSTVGLSFQFFVEIAMSLSRTTVVYVTNWKWCLTQAWNIEPREEMSTVVISLDSPSPTPTIIWVCVTVGAYMNMFRLRYGTLEVRIGLITQAKHSGLHKKSFISEVNMQIGESTLPCSVPFGLNWHSVFHHQVK